MMAYQSVLGIDAFYWFNQASVEFDQEPYHSWTKVGGQYGMQKWGLPPAIEAIFPAAALAYRQGYIEEGEPVFVEKRTLEDLWERKVAAIAEGAKFDPNRDKDFAEGKVEGTEGDPAQFFAGAGGGGDRGAGRGEGGGGEVVRWGGGERDRGGEDGFEDGGFVRSMRRGCRE